MIPSSGNPAKINLEFQNIVFFSGKQYKYLNVVHVIMIQENYFQVPKRIDNAFRDKKPSHLNDILID